MALPCHTCKLFMFFNHTSCYDVSKSSKQAARPIAHFKIEFSCGMRRGEKISGICLHHEVVPAKVQTDRFFCPIQVTWRCLIALCLVEMKRCATVSATT